MVWSWTKGKHNPFGPVGLGTSSGLSQGQTQAFLYTMEAQFVAGTNPACPWDNPGEEVRQTKFMC